MTQPLTTHVATLQNEERLRELPDAVLGQLAKLLELLVAGQERANLTAIKDAMGIARFHFADSLYGLDAGPDLRAAQKAADIGSGAGFPLLPLAMETPGCRWVAIESVGKKVKFIQETASELGLTNVDARHVRAEEAGRGELRGTMDVVTARAVGAISSLLEVALPLLRVGGVALLYKTEAALPELDAARPAVEKLGGELGLPFRYRLEGDVQDRLILPVRKIAETPDLYPRLPGVPFNKPLA